LKVVSVPGGQAQENLLCVRRGLPCELPRHAMVAPPGDDAAVFEGRAHGIF